MKNTIYLTSLLLIFLNTILFSSIKDEINKGNKYYFKQKYVEALKKYNEAELRNPDSAVIHFNSGNTLYRQKQYEDAIKRYQKALNLTKDKNFKSDILYNLGNANYKLQDIDRAREYYKQSLILNPNNTAAKYNLQQLLFVKQQDKKSKNDKEKQKDKKQKQQKSNEQKSDKQKEQDKQNKYMSKQDVDRLLEMSEQQNKDKQNILKPQKPKLPEVECDW